jgi:hypothetical protein
MLKTWRQSICNRFVQVYQLVCALVSWSKRLSLVLQELIETPYFRLYRVPLERPCLYWHNKAAASSDGDDETSSHAEEHEAMCSASAPSDDPLGAADPSAPPACSVTPETDSTSAAAESSSSPSQSTSSSTSSSNSATGTSGERQRHVSWSPPSHAVDRSMSSIEGAHLDNVLATPDERDCSDASQPTFWLDMCGDLDRFDDEHEASATYVSLPKNPERWTGYNGSEVWRALYNENCFSTSGDVEHMCYEVTACASGVLSAWITGTCVVSITEWHAFVHQYSHIEEVSDAIRAALVTEDRSYYPPRRGKRDTWAPNTHVLTTVF